MNDQWTDRLSAYLDDELTAEQRRAFENHLASCQECATTLEELRQVVGRARTLSDRPPTRDLWPGIATRIGVSADALAVRRSRRRFTFTVPQLIAASLLLALASAGAAVVALRSDSPGSAPPVAHAPNRVGPTTQAVSWASKADSSTDRAVAQLRQALVAGRRDGRLDSLTVRTLEHSLAVIDSAIDEARRALAADPKSAYLNLHLADTMRRKLEFLREATRIASPRT
jgi:anti-sigma factor RsiW